jgi:hypothetical protein
MKDSHLHPRKKKASVAGKTSLRDEVREALLGVLRDATAPPTARAIAGRSLLQLLNEHGDPSDKAPAAELSIEELDEEIAAIQQPSR